MNTSAHNYPGASASGAFPDPHRARKLATIHTEGECQAWIDQARRLGNTDAEQAGLARLYEIQRGRR